MAQEEEDIGAIFGNHNRTDGSTKAQPQDRQIIESKLDESKQQNSVAMVLTDEEGQARL